MTARTHDLGAFTALIIGVIFLPHQAAISVATAVVAFFANMLGGLFPDIDESTAKFWDTLRGGNFLGKLIAPLLGGHRLLTHSLLGIWLISLVIDWLIPVLSQVILVDLSVVKQAFLLGMASHLILDTFTKEGVPWFFPLPWSIGIPPFKWLRLKTGGPFEKSVVFPGLLILNAYLIYRYYPQVSTFITGLFT